MDINYSWDMEGDERDKFVYEDDDGFWAKNRVLIKFDRKEAKELYAENYESIEIDSDFESWRTGNVAIDVTLTYEDSGRFNQSGIGFRTLDFDNLRYRIRDANRSTSPSWSSSVNRACCYGNYNLVIEHNRCNTICFEHNYINWNRSICRLFSIHGKPV